ETFTALSRRIVAETDTIAQLRDRLEDAEGAGERLTHIEGERAAAYERIFRGVEGEQDVLTELYAPIAARIAGAGGSLRKLSFTVNRTADMTRWIHAGEALLDLRRPGAFSAPGALSHAAGPLKDAWEAGSPETVAAALATFRDTHLDTLLAHAPF